MTLSYTSHEWSNAEKTVCNLNATNATFGDPGTMMSNVDMCDLTIGVQSGPEPTDCMYLNALATKDGQLLGIV